MEEEEGNVWSVWYRRHKDPKRDEKQTLLSVALNCFQFVLLAHCTHPTDKIMVMVWGRESMAKGQKASSRKG